MFYLIGLGLDKNSITAEALKEIKSCDKVYLEGYTVDFPYSIKELEKSLKTKIAPLKREKVENESILEEAKNQDIALLVYGDALSATTHTQLLIAAKKSKIKYKVFHNASILTAIAETGLQLYKFGKTASMPNWKEHKNKPTSFIDYVKQNQSIKAHTLLLVDIGLEIKDAKEQLKDALEKEKSKLERIILISNAGTDKQKIIYNTLEKLPDKISKPYAFIIPSDMHFSEKEFLESIKQVH
tara:strand:+ start:7664 stop:8386 length:723 start_codon:yes stop_codon:yes gene_type:complete